MIIKISAAVVAAAFLLGSAGLSRCEPRSERFKEAQTQVSKVISNQSKTDTQNLEKEDHEKFLLLEWLIRQNLMKQYQQLEVDLDPADGLD